MIYENYNIILPATEKRRKSLENSNKAEDNQINTKSCRSETKETFVCLEQMPSSEKTIEKSKKSIKSKKKVYIGYW